MNSKNKLAFGNRFMEIATKEGIEFAKPILGKLAVMAIEYVENLPPWMPSDAEIDRFVDAHATQGIPFIQKTIQLKLMPAQERRMAANYSNRLPIKDVEFYLAAAERRLRVEGDDSCTPEALLELFLFLCNKRRIHYSE
jgi:hypothetical protein